MAKNKTIVALLFTIICVVLSFSVSALNVGPITGTVIQGESFVGTFTLTNDEAVNITSITLTKGVLTSGANTINVRDISLTPTSVATLNVGAVASINYVVNAEFGQAPGTYVGTVDITYNNGSIATTSANVALIVANNPNKLIFKDVDIRIDGKKKNVDDGDDFDFKLGDEIELTVEVENLFTSSEDITIENVEICVYNSDLDWDDCEDIGDIKDGKDEAYTFSFIAEYNIDSDDSPFTIEVSVEGEDEDGNDHSDYMEFELNLDKERDEVIITDLFVSPSIVSCNEDSVRLSIELTNTGRDDQTTAVLEIISKELGFENYIRSIDLDEGDRDNFDVIIPLNNPSNGAVDIEVYAYATSDKDDLTSIETISFIVTCESSDDNTANDDANEDDSNTDNNIEIVVPVTPTNPPVQTSVGVKKSFINSKDGLYIGLLILIAVLLIVLIGVLVANLAHKKK